MDKNVTEHEKTIDRLFNSQKIDEILEEYEEKGLMNSQIYNSAWEAQNKLEGQEPIHSVDQPDNQEEDMPIEEEEYIKFMREEE